MSLSKQIAKQLRTAYFGKNWTAVNLKDTLADVTWQQATTPIANLNTIATLVYHINYYPNGVTKFLEGEPLTIKDKFSFDHPPIESKDDWDNFLDSVWQDAEYFATLIEQLPDDKMYEPFFDGSYGDYYRNFVGIVEHLHYHLGQIIIIKKMLTNEH